MSIFLNFIYKLIQFLEVILLYGYVIVKINKLKRFFLTKNTCNIYKEMSIMNLRKIKGNYSKTSGSLKS